MTPLAYRELLLRKRQEAELKLSQLQAESNAKIDECRRAEGAIIMVDHLLEECKSEGQAAAAEQQSET